MFRRSNQHPAERAVMGIFVRLIGCAYLIYTIYKLIAAPAEDKPEPWLTTLILVVLIILSAVVIGMTIHEFITGIKTGRYKRSSYPNQTPFGADLENAGESPEASGETENVLTDDEAAPSGEDEPGSEDDDEDEYGEDDEEDGEDADDTGEDDAGDASGDGTPDNE
jgi:hypothetical protein